MSKNQSTISRPFGIYSIFFAVHLGSLFVMSNFDITCFSS